MKINLGEELEMRKEHIEKEKTLSYVCEMHNYKILVN